MPDDPVIEALPLDALTPLDDDAVPAAPAGEAPLPGSVPAPPGQAPLPGSVAPPPGQAPLPGSVVPPPGRAPLPGSIASPPGQAPLPGSVASPPARAPLPESVAPAPVVPAAPDPQAPVVLEPAAPAPPQKKPAPATPPVTVAAPAVPAAPVAPPAGVAAEATAAPDEGADAPSASVKVKEIGTDPGAGVKDREPLEDKHLGPALKKHVDPSSPPKVRMLAAKAMVPMAPRDQVHVLYQLTLDPHPKIAAAAAESFAKLPERILGMVAGDASVAPPVLLLLAENLIYKEALCETLLLNQGCPDSAYVWIAERSQSEKIIEIIANNQQRLLRDHDIVRALKGNEKTLKSTLERVVDFMVRNGVLLKDMPEFAESFSKLNQKELEAAVADVEVPFALLAPEEQNRLRALGKAPRQVPDVDLDDLPDLEQLDDELALDDLDMLSAAEEMADNEDVGDTSKLSAVELIRQCNIPQQVKLAMMGNKEVRSLLLRSTVRMVAEAAVRSPRITEMEVIAVASSRAVQDSVIRLIAGNREWTRLYQVKMALCNNPKTPLALSMNFLRTLRLHDLKALSKSKNVPSALMQQAKRIVRQKSGGG